MARVDTSESCGDFVPIPMGMYPLEIIEAVEKTSKAAKHLMFQITVFKPAPVPPSSLATSAPVASEMTMLAAPSLAPFR